MTIPGLSDQPAHRPAPKITVTPELAIGGNSDLVLIAGPCVLEGRDLALRIAETCLATCRRLQIPYIFKASFDKANR